MKPIIFNTEMVKAILEGRKTQTRRPIKNTGFYAIDKRYHSNTEKEIESLIKTKSPYQINDILCVRETWLDTLKAGNGSFTEIGYTIYKADSPWHWDAKDTQHDEEVHIVDDDYNGNWKPSIHMPKDYARLFLKVTGVRVERVDSITEEDAIKEGFDNKNEFIQIWDTCYFDKDINKSRGYFVNPWVWVFDFEIHEVKK
jgi:hypothetical protein